jgi:hypothetical protein
LLLDEEDHWRANTYGLLARLLVAPPDEDLLAWLAQLPAPEDELRGQPLALAWGDLGAAARNVRQEIWPRNIRHCSSAQPEGNWFLMVPGISPVF